MLKEPTPNPGGLNVVASFLVHNMLATEHAAKSALSYVQELSLNDLGGDKDWYFSTNGRPMVQEIEHRVLQVASQCLTTEATPLTVAATSQEEHNSAYRAKWYTIRHRCDQSWR